MSPVKEPRFFSSYNSAPSSNNRQDPSGRYGTLKAYGTLFRGVTTQLAIGEASTNVSRLTARPSGHPALYPHAKPIAILRDPAERAYSAIQRNLRRRMEPMHDIAQAVRDERARTRHGRRISTICKPVSILQIYNVFSNFFPRANADYAVR